MVLMAFRSLIEQNDTLLTTLGLRRVALVPAVLDCNVTRLPEVPEIVKLLNWNV